MNISSVVGAAAVCSKFMSRAHLFNTRNFVRDYMLLMMYVVRALFRTRRDYYIFIKRQSKRVRRILICIFFLTIPMVYRESNASYRIPHLSRSRSS